MKFISNIETLSNFQKKNINNGNKGNDSNDSNDSNDRNDSNNSNHSNNSNDSNKLISFEDIFININNNLINEVSKSITLFIDLGRGDNNKYSNLILKNSLFINRCISNNNNLDNLIKQEYDHLKYYYITTNSFNPNYSKKGKVDRDRFKLLGKYFNYCHNYKFNENGVILLMFNNLKGCFSNYYENFLEKLQNLIDNIRKYTNRKIVIRFHRKQYYLLTQDDEQFTKDLKKFIKSNNKHKNNNIELNHYSTEHNITQYISNELFDNTYCVFIQNTKLIFDFVHRGIPIFNLNFIDFNYFDDICIKDLSIIDKLTEKIKELPDRKDFLYKQYYHIALPNEIIQNNFKDKILEILT